MKKLFLMFAAAGILAACENPVEEITVDKTLYATGIEVVAENGATIPGNALSVSEEVDRTLSYRLTPAGSVLPEGVTVVWESSDATKIAIDDTDVNAVVVSAADGAQLEGSANITVSFGQISSTAIAVTVAEQVYANGIVLLDRDGVEIENNAMEIDSDRPSYTFSYQLLPAGTVLPQGATLSWNLSDDDTTTSALDTKFSLVRNGEKAVLTWKENAVYLDATNVTVSFGEGDAKVVSNAVTATCKPYKTATSLTGVAAPAQAVNPGEIFSLDLSAMVIKVDETIVTDEKLRGLRFALPSNMKLVQIGGMYSNKFLVKTQASATTEMITVMTANSLETPMDDASWDGSGAKPANVMQITVDIAAGTISQINTYVNGFGAGATSMMDAITGDPGLDKTEFPGENIAFTGGMGFSDGAAGLPDLATSEYTGASGGRFVTCQTADEATVEFLNVPFSDVRNRHTVCFAVKGEGLDLTSFDTKNVIVDILNQWGSWDNVFVSDADVTKVGDWHLVSVPNQVKSASTYEATGGRSTVRLVKKAGFSGRLYFDDLKIIGSDYQ